MFAYVETPLVAEKVWESHPLGRFSLELYGGEQLL